MTEFLIAMSIWTLGTLCGWWARGVIHTLTLPAIEPEQPTPVDPKAEEEAAMHEAWGRFNAMDRERFEHAYKRHARRNQQ